MRRQRRSDLTERELWDKYDKAYEDAVNETATKENPWYVLPADQKWYTRYLVSEAILDVLKKIDPQYPEVSKEEAEKFEFYRAELSDTDEGLKRNE